LLLLCDFIDFKTHVDFSNIIIFLSGKIKGIARRFFIKAKKMYCLSAAA